jgi:hypothetical protein
MQENEVIGIVEVFLFTFCLIALYHFIGAFGRHRKRSGAHIERVNQRDQDRRPTQNLNKPTGRHDASLLWSPELDARAGQSDIGYGLAEHREISNSPRRW